MVASRPSSRASMRESVAPLTEVPHKKATTVVTESTSQESGHHQTVRRPPPSNWGERVRLQRARNGALHNNGTTEILDQQVIFQDSCPYDMRERSPPPEGYGNCDADSAVKQESSPSADYPTPKRDSLVTIRARHTHFVGNTSITPMSQQYYPGRLNANYDPLTGPRFTTITEEGPNDKGRVSTRSPREKSPNG